MHSAYRLKKFIDPAKSKLLDEKIKQKNSSDAKNNKLISDEKRNKELEKRKAKQKEDNLIKTAIEK
jgi:hypothetical protein